MIDLHTHTTFSDGSLTPTELVEEAAARASRPSPSPTTTPWRASPRRWPPASASASRSSPASRSTSSTTASPWTCWATSSAAGRATSSRTSSPSLRAYRDERNARIVARLAELGYPLDAGRPRGGGRERRRRAASHRRGHAAPRLRRLHHRGLRALSAPRRARLGRPPPPVAGPGRAPAARLGRPARARPSRHHPHRRGRPAHASCATPPSSASPASSATTRCTTRRRSQRCLGAGRAVRARAHRRLRLPRLGQAATPGSASGRRGQPLPDELLEDLACLAVRPGASAAALVSLR